MSSVNRHASAPPAPARTSIVQFLWSSLGVKNVRQWYLFEGREMMFASSRTFSSSCKRCVYSSLSISRISLSFSSAISSFTSKMSWEIFYNVRKLQHRNEVFFVAFVFVAPLRQFVVNWNVLVSRKICGFLQQRRKFAIASAIELFSKWNTCIRPSTASWWCLRLLSQTDEVEWISHVQGS